jgi:hypothetical protein
VSKGRTVHVSSAQKQAAKALVSRSAKTGRFVASSVSKIANARSPRTTVVGSMRSAATGKYVTKGTAPRQSDITVTENG